MVKVVALAVIGTVLAASAGVAGAVDTIYTTESGGTNLSHLHGWQTNPGNWATNVSSKYLWKYAWPATNVNSRARKGMAIGTFSGVKQVLTTRFPYQGGGVDRWDMAKEWNADSGLDHHLGTIPTRETIGPSTYDASSLAIGYATDTSGDMQVVTLSSPVADTHFWGSAARYLTAWDAGGSRLARIDMGDPATNGASDVAVGEFIASNGVDEALTLRAAGMGAPYYDQYAATGAYVDIWNLSTQQNIGSLHLSVGQDEYAASAITLGDVIDANPGNELVTVRSGGADIDIWAANGTRLGTFQLRTDSLYWGPTTTDVLVADSLDTHAGNEIIILASGVQGQAYVEYAANGTGLGSNYINLTSGTAYKGWHIASDGGALHVPEPATLGLIACGAVVSLLRRRR